MQAIRFFVAIGLGALMVIAMARALAVIGRTPRFLAWMGTALVCALLFALDVFLP